VLTVEVYETDFDASSEYVDEIVAGSTVLSSNCNPGVQEGGAFYTCVSASDVTADVSGGSLLVNTIGSSEVNCCGYLTYYLYVKYTLSKTPVASGGLSWEGGTNSPTSGVSYSFTGLDTSLYSYVLTVEVYETDFDASSEYVDEIVAGSTVLSSNCNPGVQEGGAFYTCVSASDVTADVSGGSLLVNTIGSSEVNCCGYLTYYLYVKYTLIPAPISGNIPTSIPTMYPSIGPNLSPIIWEGGVSYPSTSVYYTFTGLDTSTYSYKLDVEVYATDFQSSNEYVESIYAAASLLSSYCDPGVDSGSYFYSCILGRDVTTDISGNSLIVQATATISVDCCSHMGNTFHVKYTLTPYVSIPSTIMEWEGGTNSPQYGIEHTFSGLDSSVNRYWLSVAVYVTNFQKSTKFVNEISAEGNMLLSYCNPGQDDGGFYYTCVSDYDVTEMISWNSLSVFSSATQYVDSYPYLGNVFHVKYTLSTSISSRQWEGGTNNPTSGVSYAFTGLDTSVYRYELSVEVYETNFLASWEYVSNIEASDRYLSSFCNPNIDHGGQFYSCVSHADVTDDVTSLNSLMVSTYATSSVDSNPYQGYVLYVRYTLHPIHVGLSYTDTDSGGSAVAIIFSIMMAVMVCCGILIALFFRIYRAKRKQNEEAYNANTQNQVELAPSAPPPQSSSTLDHPEYTMPPGHYDNNSMYNMSSSAYHHQDSGVLDSTLVVEHEDEYSVVVPPSARSSYSLPQPSAPTKEGCLPSNNAQVITPTPSMSSNNSAPPPVYAQLVHAQPISLQDSQPVMQVSTAQFVTVAPGQESQLSSYAVPSSQVPLPNYEDSI